MDERVRKAHFAPESDLELPPPATARLPQGRSSKGTAQENGQLNLKQQQQRLEQQNTQQQPLQQQQQQEAQTLTYPENKDFAHRRDIYSIHGEQVCVVWGGVPRCVVRGV